MLQKKNRVPFSLTETKSMLVKNNILDIDKCTDPFAKHVTINIPTFLFDFMIIRNKAKIDKIDRSTVFKVNNIAVYYLTFKISKVTL